MKINVFAVVLSKYYLVKHAKYWFAEYYKNMQLLWCMCNFHAIFMIKHSLTENKKNQENDISLHKYLFAQVSLCTGISLHKYLFAQVSLCTIISLHKYLFAQVSLCTSISLHKYLFA